MQWQVDNFYPIRVWLFSIILSPFAFTVIVLLSGESEEGLPIKIYSYFFYIGFLFSIPSLLISFAAFRLLLLFNLKTVIIKLSLFLLGMALFATTFSLMGIPLHQLDLEDWAIPFSYILCFLLASILFRVNKLSNAGL